MTFLTQNDWAKLLHTLTQEGMVDIYGAIVAMHREVEVLREQAERLERIAKR